MSDDPSIICAGSYTVILKRHLNDDLTECPDCGMVFTTDELLEVDDKDGELRPPRHAAIAGSIPGHSSERDAEGRN